ncbi:hypothetical protein D3C86_2152120 [compost metagenome]
MDDPRAALPAGPILKRIKIADDRHGQQSRGANRVRAAIGADQGDIFLGQFPQQNPVNRATTDNGEGAIKDQRQRVWAAF